jgi:hypothetical protein
LVRTPPHPQSFAQAVKSTLQARVRVGELSLAKGLNFATIAHHQQPEKANRIRPRSVATHHPKGAELVDAQEASFARPPGEYAQPFPVMGYG